MQYANESNFEIGYARMYSPAMTIGDRLDKAMQEAGFPSQSALSRASGVPQPTINRILKGGGKKGPETETIRRLAMACNVSFEWLNEGIEDKGRKSKGHITLVQPHQISPVVSDGIAEEIIDLITVFKALGKEQRRLVLKSAKLAAQRMKDSDIKDINLDSAED
ncbi:helix-turn-helix transcriptional regulator [Herbaspirillum huttiense]|uniref:helix-turn-helix domain-containing protein n=1 Tax=Herbaspirillum huttiense TaxID=863372 RepID=UPI0031DB73D4